MHQTAINADEDMALVYQQKYTGILAMSKMFGGFKIHDKRSLIIKKKVSII